TPHHTDFFQSDIGTESTVSHNQPSQGNLKRSRPLPSDDAENPSKGTDPRGLPIPKTPRHSQ
ncbi:hypothetical protein GIB67_007745, partial [Kingdonia uniflora]